MTFQVLALHWSEWGRNVSIGTLYEGQFALSTQLIKPNYPPINDWLLSSAPERITLRLKINKKCLSVEYIPFMES